VAAQPSLCDFCTPPRPTGGDQLKIGNKLERDICAACCAVTADPVLVADIKAAFAAARKRAGT
jgi:hypothetical protein